MTVSKPIREVPRVNAAEGLFRFQCKARKLPPFEEQYPFAESMGRKFRADFAWPAFSLLVEVSGGIWMRGGGAHSRPPKIEGDMERQQYAALLKWFLMPFTPKQVGSGFAVEWTRCTLIKLGWEGS